MNSMWDDIFRNCDAYFLIYDKHYYVDFIAPSKLIPNILYNLDTEFRHMFVNDKGKI